MKTRMLRWSVAGLLLAGVLGFTYYRVFMYAVPVDVVKAETGTVAVRVIGPGTLQARVPIVLSARTTATIIALHADEGDTVKPGELLVELDARELAAKSAAAAAAIDTVARNIAAAEAGLAKAEADLELASSNYSRDQEIFDAGYISPAALDTARATLRSAQASAESARAAVAARRAEARSVEQEARHAKTLLSHARIVAPTSGVIVQRAAEVGNTAMPGTPILRMVDPATLWISARIDESVAGRVAPGQSARIRLRTGETLLGKVARISRQADAAARELEVNVSFDQPPARFALDQEAEVTIHTGDERGVIVPASALAQVDGKRGVLVAADGRARFVAIETGTAADGRVLMRRGVEVGTVVLANPGGLRPGVRVRPASPSDVSAR